MCRVAEVGLRQAAARLSSLNVRLRIERYRLSVWRGALWRHTVEAVDL